LPVSSEPLLSFVSLALATFSSYDFPLNLAKINDPKKYKKTRSYIFEESLLTYFHRYHDKYQHGPNQAVPKK
jgi:hypothetical protein